MTIKVLFSLAVLLASLTRSASAEATAAKRSEVEKKGAAFMPFSQSDTTHVFTPTSSGGTQTVVVKDADPRQISLVRCASEASRT